MRQLRGRAGHDRLCSTGFSSMEAFQNATCGTPSILGLGSASLCRSTSSRSALISAQSRTIKPGGLAKSIPAPMNQHRHWLAYRSEYLSVSNERGFVEAALWMNHLGFYKHIGGFSDSSADTSG